MGRRVLISAVCWPVSCARYLAWGFEAAGHQVVVAGSPMGNFIPWGRGLHLDHRWTWKPDVVLDHRMKHTIYEVLAVCGPVDLVVQADAHFTLHGPSPVPNVCFAVDNHVRDYDEREWDMIFGAHSWGRRSGEANFRWLPCAYDPQWHRDLGLVRTVDAAFVGVFYDRRRDCVAKLFDNAVSLATAQGKVYSESNEVYNAARVALCPSFSGDLACRVFEGMAAGCVVVADRCADMDRIGMVEGEHYLAFDWGDAESIVDAVALACEPNRWRRITAQAKAWVAGHTWASRAEAVLREVGL